MTHPLTPTQQETRVTDDEMKLYRAFMAAQLQAAPKKTPEQEAADYDAMRQGPYQYGQGHQNILAVDYRTARRLAAQGQPPWGTPIRWYHRLWWRVKRWLP